MRFINLLREPAILVDVFSAKKHAIRSSKFFVAVFPALFSVKDEIFEQHLKFRDINECIPPKKQFVIKNLFTRLQLDRKPFVCASSPQHDVQEPFYERLIRFGKLCNRQPLALL